MAGYVNSPAAAQALEFYKGMYECCSPPGHSDAYMVANLDAYKSGQVSMQMNWFAFFPGIAKDPEVGGDKSGFFVNPSQNVEAPTSGRHGWRRFPVKAHGFPPSRSRDRSGGNGHGNPRS